MFFNTISLYGEDLAKAKSDTAKQEEIIELMFKANKEAKFSPSDIWKVFTQDFQKNAPITSIRRSITNLTDEGKLVKLPEQKMGIYGKSEYLWQYNSGQQVKEEPLSGEPLDQIVKNFIPKNYTQQNLF